jgi:hypothetical protein
MGVGIRWTWTRPRSMPSSAIWPWISE